ncbi:sigma-54-dependent transcriptional regulator [Crateriforma conspicua]|uniref:Transcriptional regulatory protein ZraR n=1 Tax=Crateriforma conspicua TaxID=2527996 RepID=A0A5C5Y7P0_9PLAN|nr:sigma-54 dependent transcriptional regulator [Crateriforma conspicua]TWT69372.1 Transcriptional regulatory protein ZraR [Crateriforma conspicua]
MPNEKTLLIVDDEASQRKLLAGFLTDCGFATRLADSGEEALKIVTNSPPDLVLLDVRLPGISGIEALGKIRETSPTLPVLLITAHADVHQAVDSIKRGADDYLAKPIDLEELRTAISDLLAQPTAHPGDLPPLPDNIVAASGAMKSVLQTVAAVAVSDAPILITGESGSGKEVIADLLHRWSDRASGPLVIANCGALTETLTESELFGHASGAFTGASHAREGYFRSADGGTLFLDEIGELPLSLQPKLLRVLESGHMQPVGSDQSVNVDVRLVAATHRDLESAVQKSEFRDDLFYRINVVELRVPPLRDRRDDIAPLAKAFASGFAHRPVRLSPQTTQCLLSYSWPGNVRELRNAIQRACLMCRGDLVMPQHLPPKIANPHASESDPSDGQRLSQVERATILATLDECQGNRTRAAEKLGISRRGLINKLRSIEKEH